MLIAISFTIIASFVLRFAFIRENKKRAARVAEGAAAVAPVAEPLGEDKSGLGQEGEARVSKEGLVLATLEDYKDKTDKQIPSFRYVL